jgi:hypothetical protein
MGNHATKCMRSAGHHAAFVINLRGVEAIVTALNAAHSHVTHVYKMLNDHVDFRQGTAEGKWRDRCRQVEGLLKASGETVEGKWRDFSRKVGGLLKACAGTVEGKWGD